jgi:hypothetical protein
MYITYKALTAFCSGRPLIQHTRFQGNVYHIATGWFPRIHLHTNIFAHSFPSNGAACQNIVTDLTKLFPGSSSVSMFKRATIEECLRY